MFCRTFGALALALQARAFDHSATCPGNCNYTWCNGLPNLTSVPRCDNRARGVGWRCRLVPYDNFLLEIDIFPTQTPHAGNPMPGLVHQQQGQVKPPVYLRGNLKQPLIIILFHHRPVGVWLLGQRQAGQRVFVQWHLPIHPRQHGPIQHGPKMFQVVQNLSRASRIVGSRTRPDLAGSTVSNEAIPIEDAQRRRLAFGTEVSTKHLTAAPIVSLLGP